MASAIAVTGLHCSQWKYRPHIRRFQSDATIRQEYGSYGKLMPNLQSLQTEGEICPGARNGHNIAAIARC